MSNTQAEGFAVDTDAPIEAPSHGFSTPDLSTYLFLADPVLRIFSVFDDLKYDRSDADMMSPAMRKHAIEVLLKHGFKQKSGSLLVQPATGMKCHIPKFQGLGASPFDILRYTTRGEGDFSLLTPTQTACQMIDNYDQKDAVERIERLVSKQPINLYRLMDYLERKPTHRQFRDALGHLKAVQAQAVASEPLCRRKALG
ncbi:MAG: hypothetical protein AAGO57_10270, partial [Pseudomonadota bacterium]